MADDPIAQYLASLNISDAVKAAAWDAAYADDDTVAEAQLRKLPKYLAPKVLETLWDLRQGAPLPADVKPFKTPARKTSPRQVQKAARSSASASEAGAALNPVTMVTGLVRRSATPCRQPRTSTPRGPLKPGRRRRPTGRAATAKRWAMARRRLCPSLARRRRRRANRSRRGDVAGGLGAGTGLVGSILAPRAIAKTVKSVPIVPRFGKNVPAPVAEAVQFGCVKASRSMSRRPPAIGLCGRGREWPRNRCLAVPS